MALAPGGLKKNFDFVNRVFLFGQIGLEGYPKSLVENGGLDVQLFSEGLKCIRQASLERFDFL